MDSVTSVLVAFGLSKNEAKVYRQIINDQETNPYAIARATGIPRTTVYEILTSLALKDLIQLNRSNGLTKQQTRILAKDPSHLRTIIRQRKTELVQMDAEIVHILPMLKKEYLPAEPNADFQFLKGIEGAKKVFLNGCMDEADLPEYVFNYKIADDAIGRDVINKVVEWENKRKRKYIPKEILPLTDWTKHCLTYHFGRDPKYIESTNMRYIDQLGFDLTNKILIKGSRIWIVSVIDDNCWGIIIRSKTLSQSLTAVFNILWNFATPITDEVVSRWGENDDKTVEKKLYKKLKNK